MGSCKSRQQKGLSVRQHILWLREHEYEKASIPFFYPHIRVISWCVFVLSHNYQEKRKNMEAVKKRIVYIDEKGELQSKELEEDEEGMFLVQLL